MAVKSIPAPNKSGAKNGKGGAQIKPTGPKDDISGRPVLYPTITVCGIEIPEENLLVSAEEVKEIMGWETESEHEARLTEGVSPEVASKMNVKYGAEYDFMDYNGEKVRCKNNVRNRPLQTSWRDQLAQDILNDNWRFNGEAAVVGNTGLVLSFQHRGLALIHAEQIRSYEGDDEAKQEKAAHWQKIHPEPLRIPMLRVCGVEETPDVTRTLDNVRPRSLSDVLFADTSLFHKTAKADREKLCRITDYAIRTVWHRTGCNDDAYSPKRTHSESLEFLSAHPRLLKAVSFIFTETNKKDDKGEKTNVLGEYMTPGMAAGLMFLMGSAGSDRERWDASEAPNDRILNFDLWEKAEEFWAGIGNAAPEPSFKQIHLCIAKCGNVEKGAKASVPVKTAVIVNAWNEFIDPDGVVSVQRIMPEFGSMDDYGNRPLQAMPSVGGIDLGDPVAIRMRLRPRKRLVWPPRRRRKRFRHGPPSRRPRVWLRRPRSRPRRRVCAAVLPSKV
jgi:hypothetical protein